MKDKLVLVPRLAEAPAADATTDEALVAAIARDSTALGVLFDRRHLDVRRFLFRLAGTDQSDLDDLVQATFLEALRSSRSFRGESSVKTWLFGIAANIVRHHVRSEIRKKTFLVALAIEPPVEPTSADALARRREHLSRLQSAIPQLPHDLRTAFVMCDIEGIAGVEAARVLGVPPGTLWRRLHDARARLRTIVGEHP